MRASQLLPLATLIGSLGLAGCGGSQATPPSASSGCTDCHGDSTRTGTALQQAAPPKDAHGQTAATQVTVGAHQAHVYGGIACATCHSVPAAGDVSHAAAPRATVVFSGNLVGANGTPVAPWNRDQPTCANYCHNPGMGAADPTPLWTRGTPNTCGSCHRDQQSAATTTGLHLYHVGTPAPAPQLDCGACHGAGYSKTGVSGDALVTHVNGSLQLLPAVGWQDPRCTGPRTCYASCHAVPNCRFWP